MLRWSDYRELGELKGALAKHAEAVFSILASDDQSAFPLVMRHLVTLGQGEEEVPNRRTAPYRDFVGSGETDQDQKVGAKGFVDLFVEKRLLVTDTDSQGEVTVSVAHEALLREWKRVKEWLAENREFLRMRDRLDSSLKLWLSRGKQKDDLLEPGLHLAEGEKLVKDFGPSLNREQIDYAPTSGGSTSVCSVTPAVQKAAESAKKKLIQLAIRDKRSPFSGLKIEDVTYRNGQLTGGGKSADFGSVLSVMRRGSVEAVEMAAAGEEEAKYAFHSFGAQFCELKVNRWTGEVRLQRITSVMDIGTVVNLKTARSQIIGGVVFGIGMALLEGSVLEEKTARYANANFADYLVATNADVPFIDVDFIIKPDTIFNPLGARGIGEIGITGMPAAIANAVYNATGRRVREFPIHPENLLLPGSIQPMISQM